jgi:hypothetical protein
MNRQIFRTLIIIFTFTVFISLTWYSKAQSSLLTPDDVVVYFRVTGQGSEYVRLSSEFRDVYNLPPDKCSLESPDGHYVAESPAPNNSGNLTIRRLDTQTIVLQTAWQINWNACAFVWVTDTILAIHEVGTQQDNFYYDFSNGTLTPTSNPTVYRQYPSMPGWIPTIVTNFILPSPQGNIYLYEQCIGGQANSSGNVCASESELVIYDNNRQVILHILNDADETLVRGFAATSSPSLLLRTYPSVAWSPTGRYLAYQRYADGAFDYFTLKIYDLASDQYIDTEWINARIDYNKAMQWSPNNEKLGFWIIGRLGEPLTGDNPDSLRTLVVFDATTSTFTTSDQPYNMASGLAEEITWSPDGQNLLFVDLDENLIFMDAASGVTTPLDNQVNQIIAWETDTQSVVCDINISTNGVQALVNAITNANSSSISQILCLEAGTYTLTASNNSASDGANGLPVITSDITLHGLGTGAEIIGSLQVSGAGRLTLRNVSVNP